MRTPVPPGPAFATVWRSRSGRYAPLHAVQPLTGPSDCGIVLDPSGSAVGPSALTGKLRSPPPVRGTLEERRYASTVKYYVAIMSFIDSLLNRDEEGQGLAEYALILALIAIVAILALIFLGQQVSKILSNVGNSV